MPNPDLSVGFILLPRFTLIAFAGFIEVLRQAAQKEDLCSKVPCHWTAMAETMESIESSSGMHMLPWELFRDPRDFDYIVVVGGLLTESPQTNLNRDSNIQENQAIREYLSQAAELGVNLVGVCTGSFALARAGLMEGRKCCVHWYHYNQFRTEFPNCQPISGEIFIIDNNRITCPGGSSTIDLALYLVERHCGKEQAMKCLRHLLLDWPRSPDHPQLPFTTDFSSIADTRIRKAIFLMEQHLNGSIGIDFIAEHINVSRRQLERLFQKNFQDKPLNYYRQMRLKYGKWLLHNTDRSITEIAIDCGFADSSHFSRWFKDLFDHSPAEERKIVS